MEPFILENGPKEKNMAKEYKFDLMDQCTADSELMIRQLAMED